MGEFVTTPQVRILTSIDELRAEADRWNQLWRRSRVTVPTTEAEPLAVWLEAFAPQAQLRCVVVEQGGQFLAALPLIETRRWGLKCLELPNNAWSLCGELAIDSTADLGRVTGLMAQQLSELGASLLWFEGVPWEREDWLALIAALHEHNCPADVHPLWPVGIVDIAHDWKTYFASRSRNHRRQISRTAERMRLAGQRTLGVYTKFEAAEIEPLLRRGFELELRSWKSTSGTCVLNQPDIFEFYCRQARALAERGHLELVFLELEGQPIAFEYGLRAKGMYFSPKVGYDEHFAEMSPGQQLRAQLYEEFQRDPNRIAIDFHGPLSEATTKWATRTYSLGRVISGVGVLGNLFRRGYGLSRSVYKAHQTRRKGPPEEFAIRPLPNGFVAAGTQDCEALEPVGMN